MVLNLVASPKVLPVETEAGITIRARDGAPGLSPEQTYRARFFSKVNRADDTQFEVRSDAEGVVRCRLRFACAGEYTLDITQTDEDEVLGSACFFAVRSALTRYRPYKGDLHIHTTGSDGRDDPVFMATRARELGMDFIAITDHDNYRPSVGVVADVERLGLDLLIIPGEEVTLRERGGHILALNADGPVGTLRHTPEAETECARLAREELQHRDLIPPLTADQYAQALWTVRKIHERGGVSAVAHPHWEGSRGTFYPPRALYEQLLRDGLVEAIELFGGSPTTEGNFLTVARHADEMAAGRRLPIIGGSDAHDGVELGRQWMMVFAEALDAKSVLGAVVDLRSVACNGSLGPDPVICGTFEWVEYAYFLCREFFPLHDAICAQQAKGCTVGPAGTDEEPTESLRRLTDEFWGTCTR